jgi:hypothetical protein
MVRLEGRGLCEGLGKVSARRSYRYEDGRLTWTLTLKSSHTGT